MVHNNLEIKKESENIEYFFGENETKEKVYRFRTIDYKYYI